MAAPIPRSESINRKERKTVAQPLEIDLAETPSLFITKAVTYDELMVLVESDPIQ